MAVLSPSFAAPGKFPEVFELGLERMRTVFNLKPVEFPTTRKLGATTEERSLDLIAAFENPEIKAVFASIGGNDQVTYISTLPPEPFSKNPKPFFGYSDNTHFANFLWHQGVPCYYGGSIMTQFAMQQQMDAFTIEYLRYALFERGTKEIRASETFNDIGLDWGDTANLSLSRTHEPNEGWYWDGEGKATGVTWGGCVESIDKLLEHGVALPSLQEFEEIVLLLETAEDIPSSSYVTRVLTALGERGILERVQGVLVGRPKAWEFNNQQTPEERVSYREAQREAVIASMRTYNKTAPIVQNLNFGHTDPQIPFPYGRRVFIDSDIRNIKAEF